MAIDPRGKFRISVEILGYLVELREVVHRDGKPHDFHVILYREGVRLTEGRPFDHWPLPAELTNLVRAYTPEPSPELAALVAAMRYACTELTAFATTNTGDAQWALRLRTTLMAELEAVHPAPERGIPDGAD